MTEKNLVEIHLGGDYDSAFEGDSEIERKRARSDLAVSEQHATTSRVSRQFFNEECSKEEGRNQRFHLLSLDAYSRHKLLINQYLLYFPGSTKNIKRNSISDRSEYDVLKENHKFLWTDDDTPDTWEKRLAKSYYDKLFKEYCISDLSRYKENKIAMRWRTEQEVVNGKGQFTCGSKHCQETVGLKSWEVNFAYMEEKTRKNALVKLRLCADCSYKLNYHHKKQEAKIRKRKKTREILGKKKMLSENSDSEKEASATEEKLDRQQDKEDQTSVWKEPLKLGEEKSVDDEFEDYLADMLL